VVVRALVAIALLGACGGGDPPVKIDDADADARAQYPTLFEVYDGEHGLYRGCGPNGGVCHNGNEYPNLSSIGSILENIDGGCNKKRDKATDIHDLCERAGDRVVIAGQPIEIAYLEPYQDMPLVGWRLVLRDAPQSLPPTGELFPVLRQVPDGLGGMTEHELLPLGGAFAAYADDPEDASGRAILFAQHGDPGTAQFIASFLAESGLESKADRIHFGDPNRNGTFGAELGGRLIKPGDPERSYLLRRLVDPTVGPLMPRANCCSWTRTSLRALWCWIDGLEADGANALDPIDYDGCRASPPVELLYPEPGPMCEAQGLCPVQAGAGTQEPTFASIYAEILSAKCSGDGCHDTGAPGGVDLRSQTAAFETITARVVAGDPDASGFYRRLDPALCTGPCTTMPLGRTPLGDDELARIRQWITDGAVDN
jgi:hypothetical protein